MRLARRNVLLLGLAVVLGGADLLLRAPSRGTSPAGALLDGLDVERVARVRLAGTEGELDLERDEDGWVIQQEQRFPAHARVVDELLGRLAALSRTDLVAQTPGTAEEFGLGAEATRVELLEAGGGSLASVHVGQPAELARGAYVRLEGEDAVYRAATLPSIETQALRWLDTQLVDLDPTRVATITVARAGAEELVLTRLRDGRWRAPGHARLLTAQTVDPLLLQSANLYFAALAPAGTGAPDTLRVTFDLDGGGRRELLLGVPDATGHYPATNSFWTEPWVVLLGNSAGARLEAALRRVETALQ